MAARELRLQRINDGRTSAKINPHRPLGHYHINYRVFWTDKSRKPITEVFPNNFIPKLRHQLNFLSVAALETRSSEHDLFDKNKITFKKIIFDHPVEIFKIVRDV